MPSDTRPSLLEELRSGGDALAWEEFFTRYWPTIYAYARRRGCSEHTAEEIVQDVMLKMFRHRDLFRYDPARGRFRDWLGVVVRNQVAEHRRRPSQRAKPIGGRLGDRMPEPFDDAPGPDEIWERVFEGRLLLALLDVVRRESDPREYLAFELYTLKQMKAADVGRVTGLTPNVVYKTHDKMVKRLRQLAGAYRDNGSLGERLKEAIAMRPGPVVQRSVTARVEATMRSRWFDA